MAYYIITWQKRRKKTTEKGIFLLISATLSTPPHTLPMWRIVRNKSIFCFSFFICSTNVQFVIDEKLKSSLTRSVYELKSTIVASIMAFVYVCVCSVHLVSFLHSSSLVSFHFDYCNTTNK